MLAEAFKGAKQWAMQQFWWTEWWMTLVKFGGCAIECSLVQESTVLWHYIVNFWYKLLDSKTDINENEGHTSLSDAPKKKFHRMEHRSHGVTKLIQLTQYYHWMHNKIICVEIFEKYLLKVPYFFSVFDQEIYNSSTKIVFNGWRSNTNKTYWEHVRYTYITI